MRQTISTKYHGPTDRRGARVSATSASGHRVILAWNHALNSDENHIASARHLAQKLQWSGRWQAGAMPNGCVFVNVDNDGFDIARETPRGA
jgi:hypothetical protein